MSIRFSSTNYFILFIAFIIVSSCNLTKNVPKGDALYTGASIKVQDSTLSKKQKNKVTDLTEHLPRPKPNSKFLGIPFKLIIYNLAGDTSKKGFIRKFLRKFGEPPVLLSNVNLEFNVKVLNNYLENIGYFRTGASGDTAVKNKKAHATYTIEPGPVYTIKDVNFVTDSSALGRSILQTKSKTLLHPNDPFNLDVVKGERLRIDAILKEEGYYYFNPDLLIVNADTTKKGDHQVNMYLMVKENTPQIARKPYLIDDVYIYPTYRINTADTAHREASLYQGFYIVDPRKRFKPKLFPRILRFDSGDVYNRKDHNLTLSRLINLDVFKYVKNRFELSQNSEGDTGRLNTYYYLSPSLRKSLRAEVSGNTKSNHYTGTLITLSWLHRNFLKGAEHLSLHANAGTEVQFGTGKQSGFNTYRLGGGLTFTTPRFVVPFFKFNTTSAYVPKSKIELNYDLLNRQKLYTLNSFKAQLGYVWKPSLTVQNELNLFSVNYVVPLNVTQLYRDSIRNNPILKHAIDTQFIIGTNYAITVDPLVNNPKGTGFYFNGLVDASGNTSGLIVPRNSSKGKKTILNVPFDQYIKAQADVRYYYALNNKVRLANRIILGMGYPYGNSRQLPFIKQYFIGGNNSIRAFRTRSVGPGTYRDIAADTNKNRFFPDQSGDLKLEFNTELRFKINNIIESAIFVDAGNIWLYNKDTTTVPNMPGVLLRPGTEFTKDFYKQLAVGAGIGLRFDLTILLLRLDVATPLRKPWLTGKKSVFDLNDLVFNLAIGYPF